MLDIEDEFFHKFSLTFRLYHPVLNHSLNDFFVCIMLNRLSVIWNFGNFSDSKRYRFCNSFIIIRCYPKAISLLSMEVIIETTDSIYVSHYLIHFFSLI